MSLTKDYKFIEKMIRVMLEVTLSVDVKELQKKIIKGVEWSNIAKKLEQPVVRIKKFWENYVYARLYCRYELAELKLELIRK